MLALGSTSLMVFPLCLGTNVFGWTANSSQAHAVLDTYVEAGGNFIDTADVYAQWVEGNVGGESETIIGEWLAGRSDRDQLVIATKVGELQGLTTRSIREGVEASLQRLQTDYIDLYYAHWDDPDTELEETLSAFDALIGDGKVRYVAASNYSPERLAEALKLSREAGLTSYVALQTEYNVLERGYEDELADVCGREGIPCVPYYSLAQGFLTGKYLSARPPTGPRSGAANKYLSARGRAVLMVLEDIATSRGTGSAAIALAWLRAQPTVIAPIASARSPAQLDALLPSTELRLSPEELSRLDAVSR